MYDLNRIGLVDWTTIEPLFDKAIISPSEITPEEKHRIAQWPPRKDMEERCQKYLGRSLDDFLQAAADDRVSLTYAECRLLHDGFYLLNSLVSSQRISVMTRRYHKEKELADKWLRALESVLTPLEFCAHQTSQDSLWWLEKMTEFERQREQHPDYEPTPWNPSRPPRWIRNLLEQEEGMSWGYVIFCHELSESEPWEKFHEMFFDRIDLLPATKPGGDQVQSTKVVDLTNYDGPENDLGVLRARFRAMRDAGEIKPGVLQHVSLYITRECRDSWQNFQSMPWLWAVDPDWSHDEPDKDGYEGRVPVVWGRTYDKLYGFLSCDGFSLKQIWQDWHEIRHEIGLDQPQPGWAFTNLDRPKWPNN
ncbi:hypothetical protein BDW74DRAFT_182031 [Aspergillus multicolor]|uniref:uncharacterized protein n=1 Tax=Aspergillus multicolor TaxID=41759 RepID=UPI003CCCD8B8